MKTITMLALLLTSFVFSQITKVEYQLEFNFPDEQINDEYIGFYLKEAIEGATLLNFELKFNNEMSSFKSDKGISDNKSTNTALTMSNCQNTIKKKNDFFFQNNDETFLPKEEFIVKQKIFSGWNITNDTMRINNLLCYKAFFSENKILPNGKEATFNTIAWFTPEFPVRFGPAGFGNLPGLILFLQNRFIVFKANIITKVKSNEILEFDLKGTFIDFLEYENKLKDVMEKQFETID